MKSIVIILIAVSFTGCGYLGAGRLKKSASGNLIDYKGFDKSKRRPLYNNKYIEKAKTNILRIDNNEVDSSDEIYDPAELNRLMYQKMIEEDKKRKVLQNKTAEYRKEIQNNKTEEYPSLRTVAIIDKDQEIDDIERQMNEAKLLLAEARSALAKTLNKQHTDTLEMNKDHEKSGLDLEVSPTQNLQNKQQHNMPSQLNGELQQTTLLEMNAESSQNQHNNKPKDSNPHQITHNINNTRLQDRSIKSNTSKQHSEDDTNRQSQQNCDASMTSLQPSEKTTEQLAVKEEQTLELHVADAGTYLS